MSSEVQVLRLKDCIERVIDNRGKTPPLSNEVSLHPLLEVNSIVGSNKHPDLAVVKKYVDDEIYSSWFRSGHPEVGDLLFSTVGSIAEVAIVKEENGCIAQNLIGIKTNTEILGAEFLYYFLTNPSTKRMVCSLDISSVQPSIKVPHLLALEIAVPALGVQEKIVNILSSLDDRITLLRETNATLEAIAQALFKSWFVDFDPVHANAHARATPKQPLAGCAAKPSATHRRSDFAKPRTRRRHRRLIPRPLPRLRPRPHSSGLERCSVYRHHFQSLVEERRKRQLKSIGMAISRGFLLLMRQRLPMFLSSIRKSILRNWV